MKKRLFALPMLVGLVAACRDSTGHGGAPVRGVIADSANDWTNRFIVTRVPQEVGETSWIWVETATGVSASIQFALIATSGFSPSVVNWTRTTDLPQPLHSAGALTDPQGNGHVLVLGGGKVESPGEVSEAVLYY